MKGKLHTIFPLAIATATNAEATTATTTVAAATIAIRKAATLPLPCRYIAYVIVVSVAYVVVVVAAIVVVAVLVFVVGQHGNHLICNVRAL